MKKTILSTFLALVTLVICCKKFDNTTDNVPGSTAVDIRGRLFLYDSISGNFDTVSLSKKLVGIQDSAATILPDFIKSVYTDSAGYFIFPKMDSTRRYRIIYTDTGANGLTYEGDTIFHPGDNNITVLAYPSFTSNNGFLYHFASIVDPTGPLPGVSVCVFANSALVADTCAGSSYQLTSDIHGRVFQMHILPPGTYYSRIHASFPKLTRTIYDTLIIPATGPPVAKKFFL